MSEVDNLFNETKDALPIPCSLLPNLIFNSAVILAFKPVSGYQLPFSKRQDVAMGDSTEYEPYFMLQIFHLVLLACLLTASIH